MKEPWPTWYEDAFRFIVMDEEEEPAVGGTGVGRPLWLRKDSAVGESTRDTAFCRGRL